MVDFVESRFFSVTTSPHGAQTRIVVRGDVDASTAHRVRIALYSAETERERSIVLDLTGVSHMDSKGLEVLEEHALIAWDGDRLRLQTSDEVQHLLETAGLAEPFARITLGRSRDGSTASRD